MRQISTSPWLLLTMTTAMLIMNAAVMMHAAEGTVVVLSHATQKNTTITDTTHPPPGIGSENRDTICDPWNRDFKTRNPSLEWRTNTFPALALGLTLSQDVDNVLFAYQDCKGLYKWRVELGCEVIGDVIEVPEESMIVVLCRGGDTKVDVDDDDDGVLIGVLRSNGAQAWRVSLSRGGEHQQRKTRQRKERKLAHNDGSSAFYTPVLTYSGLLLTTTYYTRLTTTTTTSGSATQEGNTINDDGGGTWMYTAYHSSNGSFMFRIEGITPCSTSFPEGSVVPIVTDGIRAVVCAEEEISVSMTTKNGRTGKEEEYETYVERYLVALSQDFRFATQSFHPKDIAGSTGSRATVVATERTFSSVANSNLGRRYGSGDVSPPRHPLTFPVAVSILEGHEKSVTEEDDESWSSWMVTVMYSFERGIDVTSIPAVNLTPLVGSTTSAANGIAQIIATPFATDHDHPTTPQNHQLVLPPQVVYVLSKNQLSPVIISIWDGVVKWKQQLDHGYNTIQGVKGHKRDDDGGGSSFVGDPELVLGPSCLALKTASVAGPVSYGGGRSGSTSRDTVKVPVVDSHTVLFFELQYGNMTYRFQPGGEVRPVGGKKVVSSIIISDDLAYIPMMGNIHLVNVSKWQEMRRGILLYSNIGTLEKPIGFKLGKGGRTGDRNDRISFRTRSSLFSYPLW